MKKTFLSLLLAASTFSAYGQELLEGAKFFDNWSFGVKGGVITPLKHSPFFKSMRAATGLELTKQVTPAFGIGVEGMGYINTSESKTAFDASNVSLLVRKYRINATRITAEGQGVGNMFSEPDWNRVSICTIQEGK